MGNGELRMDNGDCRMGNRELEMEKQEFGNGEWRIRDGKSSVSREH